MHILVIRSDAAKSLKHIHDRRSQWYENLPESVCKVFGKLSLINTVLSSSIADELARNDEGSIRCDVEDACGCLSVSNSSRFAHLFS